MDILTPYIPIDRRHALYQGATLPDRAYGAALFADISGFTPLTSALAAELGRQRGADLVLDYINPIYEGLVAELHRYGGSVIAFAGDSITCWIEEKAEGERLKDEVDSTFSLRTSSLSAMACAFAMQDVLARLGRVVTPGGKELTLTIKIAVAAGPARRFLAGDPAIHNFEALAGATLERMAAGEHQAEKGDTIASAEVIAALGDALCIKEWRHETAAEGGRAFAVVTGLRAPAPLTPWPPLAADALAPAQLRPWIDAPVYERLLSGAAYLAELRPVTSLFLKFAGIDYDGDDNAGQKLDRFVHWVQSVLQRYEGTMLQLTIGDKGSNLLAVFGAPIAHDDDPARAIAAALDLRRCPSEFPDLTCIESPQIGVSEGLAWAGACGGRLRCIYTVMGDEVNMAARLMGKATPGQILVSQRVADATARSYHYHSLGAIPVKGRVEPLPVAEAVSRQAALTPRVSAQFNSPLVGREDYLTTLHTYLAEAAQGRGQALRLEGVAGVGKSHLAATFATQASAAGWRVVAGLCQSIAQGMAYAPWRQALAALLELPETSAPAQADYLVAALSARNPAWELRLPLLGDLLELPIPDNPTTAALDARLRQQALFALVTEILQAEAQRQPLLLLLEDVHWIDEASANLTAAVARAITHAPLLLLVVQRPQLADQPILPTLDALAHHHRITLGDLAPAGVATLVQNRLGGEVGQLARDLVFALAQGNPFFTEELVDTLREAQYLVYHPEKDKWRLSEPAFDALLDGNCLTKVEGIWQMVENPPLSAVALDIPNSVHGTVLARMDRLSESHKLTLKVASVIGRTFALSTLSEVHPARHDATTLHTHIEAIGARDFVRIETTGEDPVYIFKHNTTQEVAYGTLLFAQRKELHGAVARWYEQTYSQDTPLAALTLAAPLAPHYPVLAHHWRNAEQSARERVYAGLAGEQAAAQFANEGAVRYFSRALELTPEAETAARYRLLLGREAVYDVMGQREPQAQDLHTLQTLSAQLNDPTRQANVALREASYARFTGDYPGALTAAQTALGCAQAAGDLNAQARSYHEWGRLLWQQGQYDDSRARLHEALTLARTTGDQLQEARSLFDIATAYYEQGIHAAAEAHYQQALPLYHATGYRRGEIDCLMMFGSIHYQTGHYTAAQHDYEEALNTARIIGWRLAEAFLLGNLGNNYFDIGDYSQAEQVHLQALSICRETGNQLREAMSLDTLGLIYNMLEDDLKAQTYYEQALTIQRELGARRDEAYTLHHLGLALESAGNFVEARRMFTTALGIRRELAQTVLTMDDLAALARIALALGDQEMARAYIEETFAWLIENSPDGIEFPARVYLTCYQVLEATGNGLQEGQRARIALESGYRLLQQRAGQIQDEAIRCQFLERVPYNRALLTTWKNEEGRIF